MEMSEPVETPGCQKRLDELREARLGPCFGVLMRKGGGPSLSLGAAGDAGQGKQGQSHSTVSRQPSEWEGVTDQKRAT